MLEAIVRSIFALLFVVLCWLVLFPVVVILATPVVLIVVLFKRDGTFRGNVRAEYRKLWTWWMEWGILFTPPW
jgi:hypothetical protein